MFIFINLLAFARSTYYLYLCVVYKTKKMNYKQIFLLRFCEDCACRRIVSMPDDQKIVCTKLGHILSIGSEANQCIISGDFEEIAASIEYWKNFQIGNHDDILFE